MEENIDYGKYLYKKVEVKVWRRKKFHTHRGTLISINGHKICLCCYKNREVWVSKPRFERDSIQVVEI